MSFGNIVNVLPLPREGRLRAFAVTSIKRSAMAPICRAKVIRQAGIKAGE
jgi:hypothetical protein